MHQTDCEPILDKIGIEYDPDEKYKINDIVENAKVNSVINV
jgi:hypothetical protein